MTANAGQPESVRHKGKPGPEPGYTTEQVIAAALDLIDEVGLSTFSMRKLADRLGMGVMTLYGYVRTREEVIERVGAQGLQALTLPVDPDASWDLQVLQFARGFRRSLLEHPGLVDMLIAQLPGPPLDPAREHVLTLLLDAGLDRRTSVEVIATVFSYTLGFAVAQRAQRISNAAESNRIARLPKDHFPSLTSTSTEYGDHLSDGTFERGLRDLTNAVQHRCIPNY